MSLVRLRTFVEVYRQHSISGAARSLNLTQPAVSQHIAGLEVAIGRPLFERQSQGVLPTAAADELAADIGDKLDAAEAALSTARARSADIAGNLHIIGHADFLAEKLAPALVPLLKEDIRVRLHAGDGPMVTQMLLEEHYDLGFSAHPVTDTRLKGELILSDRIMLVAAPEVARRLRTAQDLGQALQAEPLLAYNLERSLIDHWLEKNRIHAPGLIPALTGQDLRGLRSLLSQGFGWTLLPHYLCQSQLHSGELEEIPPPLGHTEIRYYLIWLPSKLRKPRVAHAHQTLLWQLGANAKKADASTA